MSPSKVLIFPPRVRKTRFSPLAKKCFMRLFQFSVPLVEKVIFVPWTPCFSFSDTVSTLGQSPRVEKLSSKEKNGVRGTKLLLRCCCCCCCFARSPIQEIYLPVFLVNLTWKMGQDPMVIFLSFTNPQIYRTISVFLWKEDIGTEQYLTESYEKDQRDGQETRTRYKIVTASEAIIKGTIWIGAPH